MSRIKIFDTTLRDGEQSPGVSLNMHEKLEIARQLARMKVDVIEAGFPIASEGDFEAVRAVAQEVRGPVIAGLCRAVKKDIDRAWEAVQPAEKPRIHTFIATSEIHMRYKLRKTPAQVLEDAVDAVEYAASLTGDVEFSPEDACRSELDFLLEVVEAVIDAGASVVNIPDTVGYTTPDEFTEILTAIRERVPNIEQAELSVHCHNDLGMAVANSLAAVRSGAQQIEGAINGIGERAGNTALEELIMALLTRKDFYGHETGIETTEIYKTSRLVSKLTGMPIQPNKAIVGDNAFAHEAGIHQDGVIKERTTYEIMDGRTIGLKENRIVLGKHSGRHAFRRRLEELGYELKDDQLEETFVRFKRLADRKKEVTDRDLEALVDDELHSIPETFELDYMHVCSGTSKNQILPTATLRIRRSDEVYEEAACGDGPIDAVYRTIDRITGIDYQLESYSLDAITGGRDALGEVTVRIRPEGSRACIRDEVFIGRGVSVDIIEASALAYLNAVNKSLHNSGDIRGA